MTYYDNESSFKINNFTKSLNQTQKNITRINSIKILNKKYLKTTDDIYSKENLEKQEKARELASKLRNAIKSGNSFEIDKLIKEIKGFSGGINDILIWAKDENKDNVISLAIKSGNNDLINKLTNDLKIPTYRLFRSATFRKDPKMIANLLNSNIEKDEIKKYLNSKQGKKVIELAIRSGDKRAILNLVNKFEISPETLANEFNVEPVKLFEVALLQGDEKMIKNIIFNEKIDSKKLKPLFKSINDIELLDSNIDISDKKIVDKLIDIGANPVGILKVLITKQKGELIYNLITKQKDNKEVIDFALKNIAVDSVSFALTNLIEKKQIKIKDLVKLAISSKNMKAIKYISKLELEKEDINSLFTEAINSENIEMVKNLYNDIKETGQNEKIEKDIYKKIIGMVIDVEAVDVEFIKKIVEENNINLTEFSQEFWDSSLSNISSENCSKIVKCLFDLGLRPEDFSKSDNYFAKTEIQRLSDISKETPEEKNKRREKELEKEILKNEKDILLNEKQKQYNTIEDIKHFKQIQIEHSKQYLITLKEELLKIKIQQEKYGEAKDILEQVLEFRENYKNQEKPLTTMFFDTKRNEKKLKSLNNSLKEINKKLGLDEEIMLQ